MAQNASNHHPGRPFTRLHRTALSIRRHSFPCSSHAPIFRRRLSGASPRDPGARGGVGGVGGAGSAGCRRVDPVPGAALPGAGAFAGTVPATAGKLEAQRRGAWPHRRPGKARPGPGVRGLQTRGRGGSVLECARPLALSRVHRTAESSAGRARAGTARLTAWAGLGSGGMALTTTIPYTAGHGRAGGLGLAGCCSRGTNR